METYLWILLAAGVATTAARLGWARPRASLLASAVWMVLPWLTNDYVASANATRLFAWASTPEHVGALATLVVIEALAGGWAALCMAGPAGDGETRLRRHLTRWGTSLAPSPSFVIGLVGMQVSLFHRVSGWSFTAVNALISVATFLALAVLGWAWRLALPEVGRRAAGTVPLFAALLALGAAMPPLLDSRPIGTKSVGIDLRATVILIVLAAGGASVGALGHLARTKASRKGESAS